MKGVLSQGERPAAGPRDELRTRGKMTWVYLVQWFSNCDPWSTSISLTWGLVGSTNSELRAQAVEVEPGNQF